MLMTWSSDRSAVPQVCSRSASCLLSPCYIRCSLASYVRCAHLRICWILTHWNCWSKSNLLQYVRFDCIEGGLIRSVLGIFFCNTVVTRCISVFGSCDISQILPRYAAPAQHTHVLPCWDQRLTPPASHPNTFFAEVDVCHSNPCANGATCVESADSYKCLCLPSYGGDRCEIGRVGSASANNY